MGKKLIAPLAFEGYTDTEVFNHWLEHCLLPELPPGYTLVIDNASFHKSIKTKRLIESAGCQIIFLPPYSPDFNPIEEWWAILKAKLRSILPDCETLIEAIECVFQQMDYHKLKQI